MGALVAFQTSGYILRARDMSFKPTNPVLYRQTEKTEIRVKFPHHALGHIPSEHAEGETRGLGLYFSTD